MSYIFAIRHKPTGRYLPRPPSGQKGGSWVEPALPDTETPRFFHEKRHAKTFLTVWCQGPQVRASSFDWEYDGTIPDPKLAAEPRIKEDFEVVTIYWGVKK